jgi:hypothetical protein
MVRVKGSFVWNFIYLFLFYFILNWASFLSPICAGSVALALHFMVEDGHAQENPVLMARHFDERNYPLEVCGFFWFVFF